MSIDAALLDRATRALRKVESERDALLVAARLALRELREFMPTTSGDLIAELESAIAKAEGK
jgi:predicted exporter